ncbi:hypothetical protein L207DRAFT_500811 [Hyaloscypha variabilis F]|uniref:Uncharacterized protein n=1 Tax=Hyaloscypha variabilis (strain UAMH 11265 / GT02V1 / F) TaxID=1149755 RepID=A0A2J6QZR9_HYAVF|nr:hypothetical protein L207DRAFT_500811 [Hyaloscypha variabilis F]
MSLLAALLAVQGLPRLSLEVLGLDLVLGSAPKPLSAPWTALWLAGRVRCPHLRVLKSPLLLSALDVVWLALGAEIPVLGVLSSALLLDSAPRPPPPAQAVQRHHSEVLMSPLRVLLHPEGVRVRVGENFNGKLPIPGDWPQTALSDPLEIRQAMTESRRNRKRVVQKPKTRTEVVHYFKVRDKVILSLENIKTDYLIKKLDAKYAKYTILEALGLYNFHLDTPLEIYNVFYNRLLKLVIIDPFLS